MSMTKRFKLMTCTLDLAQHHSLTRRSDVLCQCLAPQRKKFQIVLESEGVSGILLAFLALGTLFVTAKQTLKDRNIPRSEWRDDNKKKSSPRGITK